MIEILDIETWNFKSEAGQILRSFQNLPLLNLHISSSIHKILRINLRKI